MGTTKVFSLDFSNVVRSLSLLKDDYNDLDMRAGIVRQLANDRGTVFEMDLRSLVDCDIILSNLKTHLPLLRALSKQEVEIVTSDDEISFLSERSTFTFKLPKLGYLDNKFLTTEELNKVFPTKDEDLVLQYSIRDDISEFMRLTSQQLRFKYHRVDFIGHRLGWREKQAKRIASALNPLLKELEASGLLTKSTLPQLDRKYFCTFEVKSSKVRKAKSKINPTESIKDPTKS